MTVQARGIKRLDKHRSLPARLGARPVAEPPVPVDGEELAPVPVLEVAPESTEPETPPDEPELPGGLATIADAIDAIEKALITATRIAIEGQDTLMLLRLHRHFDDLRRANKPKPVVVAPAPLPGQAVQPVAPGGPNEVNYADPMGDEGPAHPALDALP